MKRAWILGSLIAFLLLSTVPAFASSTVTGGGLTQTQADQLAIWLGEGDLSLTKIFGGLDPIGFHSAADGKGRTFVVADVLLGTNHVLVGGYDPLSWSSSYDYNYSSTSRTAFLFNLTTSLKLDQNTGGTGDPGQYQTFNDPFHGPEFGAGADLYLTSSDGTTVYPGGFAYNYSYGATNLFGVPGVDPNLDTTAFVTQNFNVYTVQDLQVNPNAIPEPVSVTLLGLGLAGLACLRIRRPAAQKNS